MTAYDTVLDVDSPTSHWKLGESSGSALNRIGGGPAGTYGGSPTRAVTGLIVGNGGDGAVDLNGTSQYVSIADAAVIRPFPLTVEGWFRLDTLPQTGQQRAIVRKADNGYAVLINENGTIEFLVFNQAGSLINTTTSVAIVTSRIYYFALQWAGAHTFFYLGDTTGTTVSLAGESAGGSGTAVGADASDLIIGSNQAAAQWYDGVIDEVAIYGSQLSTQRLQAHFDAGVAILQTILPDADVTTTGWTATPLHSKLADVSDATYVTSTAA